MSVLIKGMEMPQNCQNCMDANLNIAISLFGAMCPFCEKIFVADINIRKQRHPSCPLIELPPHGRLADLDKMINDFWDCDSMIIGNYELEKIKTVIEAEGET